MNQHSNPPKFWTRLFKRLCNESFYEELQGDLEERYFMNQASYGHKKAKSVYRKEVLKMVRPSVLKLKDRLPTLFQVSLFKIHFILSLRNLKRNKVFSAVNILGLGAALSVCLFLVNMLYTGFTQDNQHPHRDRLYRITTTQLYASGGYLASASSPRQLESILLSSLPEIEMSATIENGPWIDFPFGNEPYKAQSIFVDSTFFRLFNFKTLEGNAFGIFDDLNSIAVTQEIAQKIFPNESAIGKETSNGAVIKAVIENPLNISHMDFQVIGNRGANVLSENKKKAENEEWEIANGHYYYIRLNEEVSREQLDEKLESLTLEVNKKPKAKDKTFFFESQLVSGITFGDFRWLDFNYTLSRDILYKIIVLGVVMLMVASFNYTNLSIARAIQRTKEVGIRKINGSSKHQIVSQFLVETVLFSVLAMGIAFMSFHLISSTFYTVLEELSGLFTQSLSMELIFWFFVLSIVIGLLAGLLPALYFAKISPLSAINARVKSRSLSVINLRKFVTGFQLTISMLCVLIMTIGSDLYKQVLSTDMGFHHKGLVTFKISDVAPNLIQNELAQIPTIKSHTLTGFVPGVDHDVLQRVVSTQNLDTILTYKGFASYDFDKVYQPKMLNTTSPQGFDPRPGQILVNPSVLQQLQIPLDSALGKTVMFVDLKSQSSEPRYIAGVMDHFVRNAIELSPAPFIIELIEEHPKMNIITLAVDSEDLSATLAQVETIFQNYNPTGTFEPKFVDDQIENSYTEFLGLLKAFGFIGVSIVFISILGQLGIALYTVETKVKEIGIRKVLGAAIPQILKLFLKGTTLTLTLSFLIAAPIAFLLVGNVILPIITVDSYISLFATAKGFLGLSVLVMGIIVAQTWRTARLNPSESLRSE